jgi:hypothetical protein
MADKAASAIHRFLAMGTPSELSARAVSFVKEFANAQEVGHRLYVGCGRRFPESQFWRRRLLEQRSYTRGLI